MPVKLIPLQEWAKSTYGDAAPCVGTLRRWAREDKISPPAEKHGREYFVAPDAHYAANDGTKPANVRPVRRCVEPEGKASDLLEQMINGRKKKAA
jgi:hypothetical protein